MQIRAERGEEAGGHDVPLRDRISRHERRKDRHQHGRAQHGETDRGAPIAPEAAAQVARPCPSARTRGSAQPTSASASRLPATTSVALTAVAAMITG